MSSLFDLPFEDEDGDRPAEPPSPVRTIYTVTELTVRIRDRLGFKREGLLRERWDVAGDIQDSVFIGLLAREWNGRAT